MHEIHANRCSDRHMLIPLHRGRTFLEISGFWSPSGKTLTLASDLVYGKPRRLQISWTHSYQLSSLLLATRSISSSRMRSRGRSSVFQRCPKAAEELNPMPPPSPPPSSLVAREDRTHSQPHQCDRKRPSICDGGVLGTTAHLDSTIAGSPFGYPRRTPTSDGRIRRSPSSSKRWRTEGQVLSAVPLLTAAAAATAITLARCLIEVSYPMLRSHHGRVRV
jgi:hypothetical protein